MNSDECPFSPGPGQLPPILGGRDDEQKALLNAAQRLLNPKQARGASAPVLLTGPRGNGKTCLLLWFEGAVREAWGRAGMPGRLRVLNLSADRLSPARAMNALALRGWRHFLRSVMEKVRALHPRGTPLPPPDRDIYAALEAQCRGKDALALLIDEAHILDIGVGLGLLNAWQSLSPKRRIMLVLAGTPDLVDHVSDMGASFASRSKKIFVGRVPPDGARDALLQPLRESGLELTPSQAETALSDCQRYPFFTQVWGNRLWLAARDAGTPSLADSQFKGALLEAAQEREAYYADRRQELYRLDLSECARSVADLYRSPETAVSEARLMGAVQEALGRKDTSKDAQAALTQLKHCGLVWPAPKQPNASAGQPSLWEAGIPSLMANIRANIPAHSGQ